MIEHPNSLLLHHCLQAANAGDRETLRALWSDDIVWHVKGNDRWQGELKGADDIFEYLADVGDMNPMGFHTEIEDVLVSDRRAAVICQSTSSAGESELDSGFLVVATIAHRRIQRVVTVPLDPDRSAAFWADSGA